MSPRSSRPSWSILDRLGQMMCLDLRCAFQVSDRARQLDASQCGGMPAHSCRAATWPRGVGSCRRRPAGGTPVPRPDPQLCVRRMRRHFGVGQQPGAAPAFTASRRKAAALHLPRALDTGADGGALLTQSVAGQLAVRLLVFARRAARRRGRIRRAAPRCGCRSRRARGCEAS